MMDRMDRERPQGQAAKRRNQTRRGGAPQEERRRSRARRKSGRKILLIWPFFCLLLIVCGIMMIRYEEWKKAGIDKKEIVVPDWVEQDFLTPNPYSRPQTKLGTVHGVVIHYVANKETTASQNRGYFEGLKDEKKDSKSSHFIIGLDGEVLQIVPLDEIAYASNNRNSDTISIELCHPDDTGAFTEATYRSLVRLTAWLCQEFRLNQKDVIRHHDVTGKNCPKYFVEHEDAWNAFRRDVKLALKRQK